MIPNNINKQHILKAIEEIDQNGVPENRTHSKYILVYNNKQYPPKYIITIANKHANDYELSSTEFTGGTETNSVLRKYGFTIIKKDEIINESKRLHEVAKMNNIQNHTQLLTKIYNKSLCQKIVNTEEYFFKKVLDIRERYIAYPTDPDKIKQMLIDANTKPFSYKRILESYDKESYEYGLMHLIGQLVAHYDSRGAMKQELNTYEDKRTIALVFIRQNLWVKMLLEFKITHDKENFPNTVQRIWNYLDNPEEMAPIVKDDRLNVILGFLNLTSEQELISVFAEAGFVCKNSKNNSYLVSVMLHQPEMMELWNVVEQAKNEKRRAWLLTPGENAFMWTSFIENNLIGIGWEHVGNVMDYPDREHIASALLSDSEVDSSMKNTTLALWQFAREMQVGDKVYLKVGQNTLLGIGTISSDYIFDSSNTGYQHIRKVDWIVTGEWTTEYHFPIKTLTRYKSDGELIMHLERLAEEPDIVNYDKYTKVDFLEEVFIDKEKYSVICELLTRKKNIILQGAPGVGKTFAAKRIAYSIMGEKDESRVKVIQFHQSYSYEDFIMGYRPTEKGFKISYGVFYRFCEKARNNSEQDYYFIIDEINRGNMSKIFGELLMLIENDKRGVQMSLTYEEKPFSVPENVYIIGMMNTADRSLAFIDYALRRRFSFIDLEPAFETDSFKMMMKGHVSTSMLIKIIDRLTGLNDVISNDIALGRGFRIGHSYFCEKPDDEDLWYKNIVQYDIKPMLEEYWFDDVEKVEQLVDDLLR